MPKQQRRHQTGESLVGQLVTVTVAGLLLLSSLPGLSEALDRHRLESLVAQVETEMQFARGLAVARDETVRVHFAQDARGSCYVVHTGNPGQCSCGTDGTASCTGPGEVLRHATQATADGIRISSSASEIGFDASLGTVTPTTTLRLESRRGRRVNLVLNIMGRVRSCSPDPGSSFQPRC